MWAYHSAVEAGPEHPQEHRPDHGEQIGRLSRVLERVELGHCVFPSVKYAGTRQAKVSTKNVHENGTTHVQGLEKMGTDPLVHTDHGHLDERHNQVLKEDTTTLTHVSDLGGTHVSDLGGTYVSDLGGTYVGDLGSMHVS